MMPMRGIQPGICDGLVDLLADADGAAAGCLHRDLAGEQALEDFDDEREPFLLNSQEATTALPKGRRSTLTGGWTERSRDGSPCAVAGSASSGVIWMGSVLVAPLRCDGREGGGLAGLVLQVGEEGGDGVELEAVDGERSCRRA